MSETAQLPSMAVPVWQARTGEATHPLFQAFSQSIADDLPFVQDDLVGSIAHVAGLHAAGLVHEDDAQTLIGGLQELAKRHQSGDWGLDPALEDVHMNIEAALESTCGGVAGKLHTGRSRNDQVATALVLHARRRLWTLADSLHGLTASLCNAAASHVETPWTARTHAQPAQPATIGFLLAAHAVRAHRAADHVLAVLNEIRESPLGGGAVAGSTLPLKPEATARLLGLEPLESALLATGSRDTVHAALCAVVRTAPFLSGLSTDLLQLMQEKQYAPPAGFTTGSSLMPQKRNPDALELTRAKARSLPAHLDAVHLVTLLLGLGYQRDMQQVKPHLGAALSDAIDTAKLLNLHVVPEAFQSPAVSMIEDPAILATDAAEALVQQDVAFRSAYRIVAFAAKQAEADGIPLAQALAAAMDAQDVPAPARQAALDAMVPDLHRRNTRGGPAPAQVRVTLLRLTSAGKDRQEALARESARLGKSLRLLTADAADILQGCRTPSTAEP